MRKVLIATAVLIVLVWLIPWELQPDGQIQVPPPVEPTVATHESGSTPATDNAPVISDQPAVSDAVVPPVLLPDQVALSPMAQKARSAQFLPPELAGEERGFAAEPVDPLWAPGIEGNILSSLARANLQLVTMQVECRTSMCRVRLVETPSKRSDPSGFYDYVVDDLGVDVWVAMGFVDQNGTPTLVVYLGDLQRRLPPAQREAR